MLELTRRIALGVDVGNLLELERAFQRDRIDLPTSEEESMVLLHESLGDLFHPSL